MQWSLTGANPGHSYTVKSPSSFSSSVVAPELGTLDSSLCLQRSHTKTHSHDNADWKRPKGRGEMRGRRRHRCSGQMSVSGLWGWLTFPGRASAASGAGSGTSGHCGPASCPQAAARGRRDMTQSMIIQPHVARLFSWHLLCRTCLYCTCSSWNCWQDIGLVWYTSLQSMTAWRKC